MKLLTQLTVVLAVASWSSASVVSPGSKDGNFELLILHNNDMHARFEQTSQLSGACTTADREAGKCYGGFPRVAHVVKAARKAAASGDGPPVLYLNAGDTYTGTAWFTIYKWKIAAEFVNALQPDAVSLGNHEFDNGVSGLTPFIESLVCPVLAANLNLNKEPTLQAEKNLMNSVVFNISGTQVGVIGYLTPDTKFISAPNDVDYIEETIAIREELVKLKKTGVQIFIALGHSGFAKDLQIAKDVPEIDLVIGGHTNTFLWNGTSPDSEKPDGPYPKLIKQASGRVVPVVQAYAYTKYLGSLHLIFNSMGELINFNGNPILLDNSIQQDSEVLTILDSYRTEVEKITGTVVGNTSVILDSRSCRKGECNLGNLITDSAVYKYTSEYKGKGWTDAPIAIIQRGGIRAPIAHLNLPASVTRGDLFAVMPFEDVLVKVTVDGNKVLLMLEHAVERMTSDVYPGEFLHFSGLKVVYDTRKRSGSRVVAAYARCGMCEVPTYSPVNKTKSYNILMSSFLSNGGDAFFMLVNLPSTPLNYSGLDALQEYIPNHSPLYPEIEGRITFNSASSATLSLSLIIIVLHILIDASVV